MQLSSAFLPPINLSETVPSSPTNHLPTPNQPPSYTQPTTFLHPTNHLPTPNQPPSYTQPTTFLHPTNHLPTPNQPPSYTQPTTFLHPTNHLPTPNQPPSYTQPTTFLHPTNHLPTSSQPPSYIQPTPFLHPTNHLPTSNKNSYPSPITSIQHLQTPQKTSTGDPQQPTFISHHLTSYPMSHVHSPCYFTIATKSPHSKHTLISTTSNTLTCPPSPSSFHLAPPPTPTLIRPALIFISFFCHTGKC